MVDSSSDEVELHESLMVDVSDDEDELEESPKHKEEMSQCQGVHEEIYMKEVPEEWTKVKRRPIKKK